MIWLLNSKSMNRSLLLLYLGCAMSSLGRSNAGQYGMVVDKMFCMSLGNSFSRSIMCMKYKLIARIQASICKNKVLPFPWWVCSNVVNPPPLWKWEFLPQSTFFGWSSHVCYMTPDPVKLMGNIITHNVWDMRAGEPLPHTPPTSLHFTVQKWSDVPLLWRASCIWVNTAVSFWTGHISQIHSFNWAHYSTYSEEDRQPRYQGNVETAGRPEHRREGITMLDFSSTTNLEVWATPISSYVLVVVDLIPCKAPQQWHSPLSDVQWATQYF